MLGKVLLCEFLLFDHGLVHGLEFYQLMITLKQLPIPLLNLPPRLIHPRIQLLYQVSLPLHHLLHLAHLFPFSLNFSIQFRVLSCILRMQNVIFFFKRNELGFELVCDALHVLFGLVARVLQLRELEFELDILLICRVEVEVLLREEVFGARDFLLKLLYNQQFFING